MSNDDETVELRPGYVAVRYGQHDDLDGPPLEMFRVELQTNLGPFALIMPPQAVVELTKALLGAYAKLPEQRAEWAARRQGRRA